MRLSTRARASGAIALFVWVFTASDVAAQSSPGKEPEDDDSTLKTIVVTAERRVSTVQTTPISITALSGKELQESGVFSAQGIVNQVPGISVASAGPGNAVYQIRGLTSPGGESTTIGFYLDDIPITPPVSASFGKVAIDPDLYDLERVEVLRGPQGTLYGAGSMGGTIRLITSAPDTSGFYGSSETIGSGTRTGGANYGQNAAVNMPLNDTTAVRLVGSYLHMSGWLSRVVGGLARDSVLNAPGERTFTRVNDEDLYSARASFLFKTDNLLVKPTLFFQDIRTGGMSAYDSDPGTPAHYQPYDVSEPSRDRFFIASLPITYDFAGVSLTSVSGYWNRHSRQLQDGTEQAQNVLALPSYDPALGGIGPAQLFENDGTYQFSQELRVASTGTGPLKWLGGAFYSKYHTHYLIGTNSAPEAAAVIGTSDLFTGVIDNDIKQEALFAHLTYDVTPKLKAEAGARYFHYQNSQLLLTGGAAYGNIPPAPLTPSPAQASDSGVNPMFNVSYSPSSNAMIYVNASKGFREGGGNYFIPTSDTSPLGPGCLADLQAVGRNSVPTLYKPDSVWNYELGEKSQFFSDRLRVNADVYYIRWSNVQSFVQLNGPDPCNMYFTDNGSNATVKGAELEVKALLTPRLELTQNVGYTHAVYTNNDPASGIVDGQKLYDVPEWTVSTALKYEHPISRFDFFALLENSFTSSSWEVTYQHFTLPSRDLANVRAGFKTQAWSASLFADNVLNRHFQLEYLNLISFTGPPYSRISTNRPLTVGLDFSYNF